MKTGVLTDPYGNPIRGGITGGLAPAIDANHQYVYACNETSGTTLVNTGAGANGDLTIQGSAGTNYNLASSMITRSSKSFMNMSNNSTGGAWSGTSCSIAGGDASIEAFIMPNISTSGYIVSAEGATPANDYFSIFCPTTPLTFVVRTAVAASVLSSPNIPLYSNKYPIHILATYTGSTGTIRVYINGDLFGSSTYGITKALATMTAVSVGNKKGSTTNSFKGYIMQARFSDSVRSSSYALSTAKTLFAM